MNLTKILCGGSMIFAVMLGDEAWARGHHHFSHGFHAHPGISFHFGLPLAPYPYYPYYPYSYYRYRYYDYPYYYPPVVAVPSTPPVYIEQPRPETQQFPAGYWYYCSNPEGYYPYVKECPGGWQQVDPAPSDTK